MKRYECYYTNDFGDDYPALERESADGDWVRFEDAESLQQENERLRALLAQAPIAKVTVQDKWPYPSVSVELYAPGLPPGQYDLYLMPDVPQSGLHP